MVQAHTRKNWNPKIEEVGPPIRYVSNRSNVYYRLNKMVKLHQSIFIPIGDENDKNLRQRLTKEKKHVEKKTGKKFEMHKNMRGGKVGFRIWLTKTTNESEVSIK